MLDITILSNDEVRNKEFVFLRKNGFGAKATDLYYLLGGYSYYIAEDDKEVETEESLINRIGTYWLNDEKIYDYRSECIGLDGKIDNESKDTFDIGCRPVVNYSQIKSECYDKEIENDVLTVSNGEYPQYVVEVALKEQLEKKYENNELMKSGKKYTFHAPYKDYYDPNLNGYDEFEVEEYALNGKKYIRFEGLKYVEEGCLSNKEDVEEGKVYWLEVKPIRWLVDEEKDVAITEKVILGGIQYYSESDLDWGDDKVFSTSTLNNFLNKHFNKDIIAQNKRYEKHTKIDGVRKGIKLKNINIEKLEKIINEEPKSIDKEKIKTKKM